MINIYFITVTRVGKYNSGTFIVPYGIFNYYCCCVMIKDKILLEETRECDNNKNNTQQQKQRRPIYVGHPQKDKIWKGKGIYIYIGK